MTNRSRNSLPIMIAGGGIGGLACALALAQRGYSVVVCERLREFGEVGAGLQVAPNALSVLDALGIGDRVKKKALLIERMMMMDAVSGEPIIDIPCGVDFERRFGNPYAVAHRADVHGAILDGCREQSQLIDLRSDRAVTEFSIHDTTVSVKLSSGEVVEAAALIGADGLRSRVRDRIIGDGEPSMAGAVIYRALIPAAQMPEDQKKPFPTMWAGPGLHIIYYPVSDWSMFNLGVTVVADPSRDAEGKAERHEVLPLLPDCCEAPLRVVRIPASFQRYVIRYRDPVDNWTLGPVTLLGDAAHPMVQYIAQGAAMALEDAMCLAVQIDMADGDITTAFARYQDLRIARSARVQISSLLLDRVYHASGVERLVRNGIFKDRTAAEHYERFSWLWHAPPYVAGPERASTGGR